MNANEEFNTLAEQWEQIDIFAEALKEMQVADNDFAAESISRALEKIEAFEPTISVIGQVKAGKSTLLNAVIGRTGFLPSDVNPWTSVITSLHLNSRRRPPNTRALFRFFDSHEWDRLSTTGGRLGEMANRVGHKDEADEVRRQVHEMREMTEDRLGDDFENLLGSNHAFAEIEQDTIDRYICYGDPEELADGNVEGVYADITKSADLYLDDPSFPSNICLRDTPGVNDTFMMREQTTLNAIGESRGCIVVLSAHQALTTMDMALLRIICAIDAREVMIFVNRMDELADPAGEEQKIRASILKTLSRFGMGDGIEILFGSGYWAQVAQTGSLDKMAPASKKALIAWGEAHDIVAETTEDQVALAKKASGLSTLMQAMAKRVSEGPTERLLTDVTEDAKRIISMASTISDLRSSAAAQDGQQIKFVQNRLKEIAERSDGAGKSAVEAARSKLDERLRRCQTAFIASALTALETHISTYGEVDKWSHDPMSLRMSMRAAYFSCCRILERDANKEMEKVSEEAQFLVETDLGLVGASASDEMPLLPIFKTPSSLSQTISLDLNGSWWGRFWKFDVRKRVQKKYQDALIAETSSLIQDVMSNHFDPYASEVVEVIEDHVADQTTFIEAILDSSSPDADLDERSVA